MNVQEKARSEFFDRLKVGDEIAYHGVKFEVEKISSWCSGNEILYLKDKAGGTTRRITWEEFTFGPCPKL